MKKSLYRSKNDRMIAGVCGGIGDYFGIDSTIVRLIWVFLFFGAGFGALAYLICIIIIPEEY